MAENNIQFIGTDYNTLKESRESFLDERNSMRRFLASIAATTFSIFVALHPQELMDNWLGWIYIVCVVLNAVSIICFIYSAFGRSEELYDNMRFEYERESAAWTNREMRELKTNNPKWFSLYVRIGLFAYISSIVAACGYLIGEMIIQ